MSRRWSLLLIVSLLFSFSLSAEVFHSADVNQNWNISLTELLRVIQLFNVGGYRLATGSTEDGFEPLSPIEEGEGEGEGVIEGEGAPDGEGENEGQIEGELTPLSVTILSPADGSVLLLAGSPPAVSVTVSAQIGGQALGLVEVTVVSSEGEVRKVMVMPPATVTQIFSLTLSGSGLMSVQAKVVATGEIVRKTVSVTVE